MHQITKLMVAYVCLLAILIAMPVTAYAQLSTLIDLGTDDVLQGLPDYYSEKVDQFGTGPVTDSYFDDNTPFLTAASVSANATAEYGILRAGAYGAGELDPIGYSFNLNVRSRFVDSFTISSPGLLGTPGTLSASIMITGSGYAREPPGDGCCAGADNIYYAALGMGAGFSPTVYDEASGRWRSIPPGYTEGDPLPVTLTVTIPFEFGEPNTVDMAIQAVVSIFNFQIGTGLIEGDVNLMGTAAWLGFDSVLDGGGSQVTDFTVQSTSGFDYSQPHPSISASLMQSIAALPNIGDSAAPEIAVLMPGVNNRVHIRDGNTDALISDIDFGDDPVAAMVVIDDISGNGMPEVALLGTRPDNNVRVQVKDSLTGATVNNIFYGSAYSALDMTVLPDTDGNGADELAVVGADAAGGVRVQARDALTDLATSTTFYSDTIPPQDVLVIPDLSANGEPEVLVHGRVTASGQGRAIMKDSATRGHLNNFYFGTVYVPIELAPIQDISGDGIADLAQLGKRDDTGAVRIQTKRSDTGATVASAYTGTEKEPIAILGIDDANGNSAPDVAMLAMVPAGTARIVVRDGATGAFIRNIFVGAVSNPVAMTLVDDMDSSGAPELAVLGDDGAGTKRVQIKDSISGAQINTIDFP